MCNDVKALFARSPVSHLIKPGDILKECKQKSVWFHKIFHGLKITNWNDLHLLHGAAILGSGASIKTGGN